MAILAVPPVLNGAGDLVPARLFVRLMLANGTSAIGFVSTDLVTEFQNLAIPAAGLEVPLNPQALIAMESGAATYYEVRIQTAHRTERFVVQLEDVVEAQDLSDLVGITIDAPAGAIDGQIPVYDGDENRWTPTTVLSGLTKIAVVDTLPDPQVTGTLYFVKP